MNIERNDIEAIYGLTPTQQGILFHSLQEPQSGLYIIQFVFEVRGQLEVETFSRAWQTVCDRHPILRTAFTWKSLSKMFQVVLKKASLPLDVQDWRGYSGTTQGEMLQEYLARDQRQGFDFASAPLMRLALFRLEDDVYQFFCSFHHLILDGWSYVLLVNEVYSYYRSFSQGQDPKRPDVRPYRDYIRWLETQDFERARLFWTAALDGKSTPTPFPFSPTAAPPTKREQSIQLSAETTAELRGLAQTHHLTLNTIVQGAWALLLSLYSSSNDVLFGATVAGRPAEIDGVESMVGLFINTLPVRMTLDGSASVIGWLKEQQQNQANARAYEYAPLVSIQGWSQIPRNMPLFETIVGFQNYPTDVFAEDARQGVSANQPINLGTEIVRSTFQNHYPLTLTVHARREVKLQLDYDLSRCADDNIEAMLARLRVILENMAANPEQRLSELCWLDRAEQHRLLVELNRVMGDWPLDQCVHRLFAAQAKRTPDRVALVHEGSQLSYEELNGKANQLAHYLQAMGVREEVCVGVCVERGLELVVVLLGVLKAGGAYVPVDASYPVERQAYMLDDARVPVLVTQESLRDKLPSSWAQVVRVDGERKEIGRESRENPDVEVTGENLAYVIYTSGSTGQPKGVMIRHSGLSNHMEWIEQRYGIGEEDCVYQKTPYSFDASVWEFYAGLMTGGRLVVAREGRHQEAEYLVEEMLREGVTIVQVVPTMLGMLVEEEKLEECKSVRAVFSGGEALQWEMRKRVEERMGGVELVNLYGPTETTIDATHWSCRGEGGGGEGEEEERGGVPIGKPVANAGVYVLDGEQRAVPMGVNGELYISGAGIARGYLGKAELTGERMVPNGYSEEAGARMYRTGDVVRWRGDGNLEFWGRVDHQVKVRGYRIELGEIEEAMCGCEGIRQAVVIAREDERGEKRLVGYVVSEKEVRSSELRERLKGKLPEYMVPSVFVRMEELPVTPSGKLDRKALPNPEQAISEQQYEGPRTPVEEILAGIFAQLLEVEQVGIHDNFFELGGHSLLATQVISRIRTTFGRELALRVLFERPTVEGLAEQVEQARLEGGERQAPPLVRQARGEKVPLSFAQQRLWFIDQLEPGSAAYNIAAGVRLKGELDEEALRRSFEEIVRRHEVLRTRFETVEGEPVQVISEKCEVEMRVVELRHLGGEEREEAARERAGREAERPFDLSRGPLLRTELMRLGEQEHVLLVTMHHVVSDGWSVGILIRELTALYEAYSKGEDSPLAELGVQYADFAMWQREWLQGEVLEEQLGYWRGQLNGLEPLELPTDHPRPHFMSNRGSRSQFVIPAELVDGVRTICRKENATLYMMLVAAFELLLSRYTEQEDVAVGTVVANRNQAATEPLIGFFVNQLVIRASFAGNPQFIDLLRQVREVTLSAYDNQDLPFEKLVEELAPHRDFARTPLFQVVLAFQNASYTKLSFGGLQVAGFDFENPQAKFDLTLLLAEHESKVEGSVEYAIDLFDSETMERLCAHLLNVLSRIADNPQVCVSDISFLSVAEQRQLLIDWNDTRREIPRDRCIQQLFGEQVARTPDRIAVVFQGDELTYLELESRSNTLGQYLRDRGVEPETPIAVLMERSVDLCVTLLAVLKAGGAYVPLDPASPPERLSFMLADAEARLLITQQFLLSRLPEETPETIVIDPGVHGRTDEIVANTTAENLAYIIYTSGSTGRPKGVAISHRNIVRLVKEQNYFEVLPSDRFLQFAPVSFDASTFEIWACLLNGACLVVAPPHTPSLKELGDWLNRFDISVLWLTAGLFHQMVEEQLPSMSSVRHLLVGGDVISSALLEKAMKCLQGCELMNGYGPTENTTFTTFFTATDKELFRETVPIGRPIVNTRAYVIDRGSALSAVGIWGELYAGGDGVGRGYLRRPDVTAERFVPDPFSPEPGARSYRTGDRVRWRSDGTLEFDGRLDQQVKVRGFRIELGEIEATLSTFPTIKQAAVIVRELGAEEKRIIAYVVADEFIDAQQVRKHLQRYLPEYMLPFAIIQVSEFPLTANGKLDRAALPQPECASAQDRVDPKTPIAGILLGIFQRVLRNENAGINSAFFELGGHSLLATQVISRIRATFGIDLPLRALFESPTVAELTEHVQNAIREENRLTSSPMTRQERVGLVPLSHAQQRLWFVDQLQPGGAGYNIPIYVRLRGKLRLEILEKTISEIVRRHEILRTSFLADNGEPYQLILPASPVSLPLVDLSGLTEQVRKETTEKLLAEIEECPFNLSSDRLFRAVLLQLNSDESILAVTMHHIVSDAWSLGVLIDEFEKLYTAFSKGRESSLADLELQYADFAVWQRDWLQGEVLESHLAYWRQKLSGLRPLALPTDYPRSSDPASLGEAVPFSLSEDLSAQIRWLSQSESVTVFMTLLAAFQLLLGKTAGQSDISVGTSIAGRNRIETEPLIGFFVNELVLRTNLDDATDFRSLLRQVRQTVIEAYTYQDMPFERLVENLAPDRISGRSPLFDVLFVVHNTPISDILLPDIEMSAIPSSGASSKFDLTLFMNDSGLAIGGEMHFGRSLFERRTIERFVDRFREILEEVCLDPDTLLSSISLVSPAEAEALILDFTSSWQLVDI